MTTLNRYVNIVAAPASFWAAVICFLRLVCLKISLPGVLWSASFLLPLRVCCSYFISLRAEELFSQDKVSSSVPLILAGDGSPAPDPPSFLIWAWDWPGWRSSQSWCLLKDSRFIISSNVGEEVTKKKKTSQNVRKRNILPPSSLRNSKNIKPYLLNSNIPLLPK